MMVLLKKTDFENIETIGEIKEKFLLYLAKNTKGTRLGLFLKHNLIVFKREFEKNIDELGFEGAVENSYKRPILPFIKRYSHYDDEFEDLIPQDLDRKKYSNLLWEIFSHRLNRTSTTIILGGYSVTSQFPSLFEFDIYFNENGEIIHEIIDENVDSEKSLIKLYAVDEGAYAYISGVSDDFIDYLFNLIENNNHQVIEKLKTDFESENIDNIEKILKLVENRLSGEYSKLPEDTDNYRLNSIDTLSQYIEDLPLHIHIIFVELLIQMTAMKQITTSENETVSLSNDILIMEKDNGFKWAKLDDRFI